MPEFLPRHSEPVRAIRLREDLLANKGDWLVIHGDERIEVMGQSEFAQHYTAPNGAPAPKGKLINLRNSNSKSRRVLLLFPPGDGTYAVDTLASAAKLSREETLVACGHLVRAGFLQRHASGTRRHPIFTLTPKGRAFVQEHSHANPA